MMIGGGSSRVKYFWRETFFVFEKIMLNLSFISRYDYKYESNTQNERIKGRGSGKRYKDNRNNLLNCNLIFFFSLVKNPQFDSAKKTFHFEKQV